MTTSAFHTVVYSTGVILHCCTSRSYLPKLFRSMHSWWRYRKR